MTDWAVQSVIFLSKYLLNSVSQGGAPLCLSIGILRLVAYLYN